MITAGIIGWPVAHSKSPVIHRFWLGKLGIDGDYARFAVHPDGLARALRGLSALGVRGVNVTVPHKVAAMRWVDSVEVDAERIGAINCILVDGRGNLIGTNTDDHGFADPLHTVAATLSSAVVIGAGGAARAVLSSLQAAGVADIVVLNRDPARLAALAQDFRGIAIGTLVPGMALPPAALIVNATSLGMTGQPPLDVDLAALAPDTLVYDLVYAPLVTPLLAAAQQRGLATIGGLAMLIGQAALAFEFFYGAAAPREHDAELRALLTA